MPFKLNISVTSDETLSKGIEPKCISIVSKQKYKLQLYDYDN